MKIEMVEKEHVSKNNVEYYKDLLKDDNVFVISNAYGMLSRQSERLGKDPDYFGKEDECFRIRP